MKYMGSKARISKYILPIILKDRKPGQYFVEPFCGGCNITDKVVGNRIANDSNPYLIAMFKEMQNGEITDKEITREHYNNVRKDYNKKGKYYDDSYIGYIGFIASFNGRFFDGGYSGKVKTKNGTIRDYIEEARRNIIAQIKKLIGVCFLCRDYKDLILPACSIIYCDPPYKNTKQYRNSLAFNHTEFWKWCREKSNEGHSVFISEYEAPEDFKCIWEMPMNISLNQNKTIKHVEKLFVFSPDFKQTKF